MCVCCRTPVCLHQQLAVAPRQLWILLKIRLSARLLQTQPKLLRGKGGATAGFQPVNRDSAHVFTLCLQLEVLHLLTPKQLAEMLLLPLPTPPEKHVVIDSVMDFLLETPFDGRLMEILHLLAQMAEEVTTV